MSPIGDCDPPARDPEQRRKEETTMTKLMPCLWFDDRIDEAITFYTQTFKSAKVHEVVRQAP